MVALVDIHGACGCEGDCGGHQSRDDVDEAPAEPFAEVLAGIAVGTTFHSKMGVSLVISLFFSGLFILLKLVGRTLRARGHRH